MILRFLLPLLFAAATASAAPFSPEPLKISGPPVQQYEFDSSPCIFSLELEGGPASVTLALFTKNVNSSIRVIRSGHLGWHYVNGIDTCFYISPPYPCTPGQNTIPWDGRDADGRMVTSGDYTYYLWGIDTESPPRIAARDPRFFRFDRATVVMYHEDGHPLSNPVLFSAAQSLDDAGETWNTRAHWKLGGDPDDATLIMTTRYRSAPDRGRMAQAPGDLSKFFTQTIEPGMTVTRKWVWVPNGDAVPETSWGNEGLISVPSALDLDTSPYSGPVIDSGMYLLSADLIPGVSGSHPVLDYLDASDGTPIKRFDLSRWYGADTATIELAYGAGRLLLSSPGSALFQMVNPVAGLDNEYNFVVWQNGAGDGFADTVPASGKPRGVAMDQNGFAFFAEDGAAPSIRVFTPDGAGMGLFPLPGMAGGTVTGFQVIDLQSSYDGLYYSGATAGGDSAEVWYTGYDVFKGDLWGESWNFPVYSPPSFSIPAPSEPLRPGTVFALSWKDTWPEPLIAGARIMVSFDDRQTWTILADRADSRGTLHWTVPAVSSTVCWLSVGNIHGDPPWSMLGPFAIEGPVSAADASPRVFGLRPNTPNPFNPSTTLSFALPVPGNATLTVYDTTGRKVTELAHGFHAAGEHSAIWNAKGCASGVYFAVLKAGEKSETRKMLLVR